MRGWGLYLVSQGLVDYMLLKTGRFDLVETMFLSICSAPLLLWVSAEIDAASIEWEWKWKKRRKRR